MAIFTNAVTLTGGTTDDFLLGNFDSDANNTMFGGAGRDYMIGDTDVTLFAASAGTNVATAYSLTGNLDLWSTMYNPDIANSTTVAHATAIIDGSTQAQWYTISVFAGQVLTLDIDYGDNNLGGNTNTLVTLLGTNGTTTILSNDNGVITDGAGGSNSTNDSFLTYTFTADGTYYIRVEESGPSNFEAIDTYMMNISLSGQDTTTPASGNDDLYGGTGNDVMYGIGGNDRLYGGDNDDLMTGDVGNDTLDGGAGNDKVYGGENNDTFVLTNGFNTVVGDEIYGGTGTDTLDLSALTGLTSVVVNLTTGQFTHAGVNDVNTIVDVENAVGTTGNDSFIGNALVNAFYGGAGNDTFEGGDGTDKFYGGLGNDTYLTNSSAEIVSEIAGEGTNDVVIASSTFALSAGSAVEVIQTSNAAGTTSIALTGNALAQSITGNAGNNALDDGGAGAADTLTGNAGNDTYYVNNAGTIIVEAGANGTNDRVASSVTFTLAADDAVELLTTDSTSGTTAINLTGNALVQTITGNNGDNVLNSGGTAADTLVGNAGNDTYVVNSAADVIIESAGKGTADRVNAAVSYTLDDSDEIEILATVNAAATTAINLIGNVLSQTITGNAGNNVIDGKGGVDTLTGGAGNDTFSFSTAPAGNIDVVTDYAVANDTIELSNVVYTGLAAGPLAASAFLSSTTGAATTATQRIIYNSTTGALTYDADGNGAGAAVQIATLSTGLAMVATEFNVVGAGGGSGGNIINGSSASETLTGTAVSDTMYGFAGNDTLNGGLGSDMSFGGVGNDIYVVEGSSDVVTEFAGEGTNDVVQSAGSFALTAGSEVELIETQNAAGTGTINLTGNALAQSIIGNAGNNSLDEGGVGLADTMTGGAGNDIYYISNAGATIVEVAGGGTADRVAARASFTLAADDDIETMTTASSTGTTAINLTGNALKQAITGNAGDNVLNTGGGVADTMTGLAGNDTYVVNNAGDVIIEGAGQGTVDRVNAAVSFVLDASDDIELLQTTNAASTVLLNLTGNGLIQTIIGNAGDNVIDGKAGADALTGGAGNDTFAFSTGLGVTNIDTITDYAVANDTISLNNTVFTGLTIGALTAAEFLSSTTGTAITAAQRIIYNSTTGALSFDADGNGAGVAVQFATLSAGLAMVAGEFVVAGTGGGGSVINGDGANNNLVGTTAVDTLNGFAGNDTLNGGLGNDVNFGGTGNDIYIVEGSADKVTELGGEGTNDVVRSIGTFVLTAGSEVEVIETSNAALTNAINLTGNALAQSIIGNAGTNALDDGGAGAADTLTGGAGNDIYYVTNAGTIIVEGVGTGTADRVAARVSFVLAADDNIETMTTASSTGTTVINLTGNALKQSITGNAAGNTLDTGGGVADTMTGLLGNDTYVVHNAADVIVEIAGGGTADRVQAAVSFVLDASDDIEFLETTNAGGSTAINLTGNGLNQTLTGNGGVNILDGKGGNDILIDGNGADTFQFSSALNATTNVDTIAEYDSGTDIIALSSAIFGTLSIGFTVDDFVSNTTGLAETAEQNIIYNTATGALSYDADGLDGAAAIQFATLTVAPAVAFTDFIIV